MSTTLVRPARPVRMPMSDFLIEDEPHTSFKPAYNAKDRHAYRRDLNAFYKHLERSAA
jgi:hypothetical protein